MRFAILTLVFLSLLLSTNLAWGVAWTEVTRFMPYWGTAPNLIGHYQTDNFTCSQAEWRIVWNYTPLSTVDPENVYFNIFIYRTNDTVYYMMEMNQQGNTTTSGTWYINNLPGEFFLKFLVYNVLNATAVIEQDIESIPEFSLLILVSFFATGTLAAMMLTGAVKSLLDERRLKKSSDNDPRAFFMKRDSGLTRHFI